MNSAHGNVFMVVAPSGAGKSSLVNALLKDEPTIGLSISCTTRAPRSGEIDGKHYYFIDLNTFQELKESNGLLEWAKVHDNFYGTPVKFIEQRLEKGEDILLEIDWQGAQQVRKNFPDVIDIFILPPSYEALKQRLNSRGQDSQEVIQKRLNAAQQEILHASSCRYVIINENFDEALNHLKCIIEGARLRYKQQACTHQHIFKKLGLKE